VDLKISVPALLKRYAIVVYVVLAVLISWFPWYTSGSGFFVWGASIAGIITIALTAGKDGMRDLVRRLVRWRVGVVWWAVALFFTGVLALIAIGIDAAAGGGWPGLEFFRRGAHMIPVFFLFTLLGGPLGEEFGWRGFALPYLQRRGGPVLASLLIGVIWGLWHLPLFFQSDSLQGQLGLRYLPLYVLAEVILATFLTWVYNKTGGSLLVAGIIMHNADNFWGVTFLTDATYDTAVHGGATAQVDMRLYIITTIVSAVAAIILVWATRWRLGQAEEAAEASAGAPGGLAPGSAGATAG
jgi:membrane protease YdiL (CAAX protease family)